MIGDDSSVVLRGKAAGPSTPLHCVKGSLRTTGWWWAGLRTVSWGGLIETGKRASWPPTLSAENALRMGHPYFCGGETWANHRSCGATRLRVGSWSPRCPKARHLGPPIFLWRRDIGQPPILRCDASARRFVVSQVPKSEAPGAPIFLWRREMGQPPILRCDASARRFVVSQVPKSEAPGAPVFCGGETWARNTTGVLRLPFTAFGVAQDDRLVEGVGEKSVGDRRLVILAQHRADSLARFVWLCF